METSCWLSRRIAESDQQDWCPRNRGTSEHAPLDPAIRLGAVWWRLPPSTLRVHPVSSRSYSTGGLDGNNQPLYIPPPAICSNSGSLSIRTGPRFNTNFDSARFADSDVFFVLFIWLSCLSLMITMNTRGRDSAALDEVSALIVNPTLGSHDATPCSTYISIHAQVRTPSGEERAYGATIFLAAHAETTIATIASASPMHSPSTSRSVRRWPGRPSRCSGSLDRPRST